MGQSTSLDFYVGRALENSPLLNDYRNQALSGQLDSQLIKASYLPQVTGTSSNTYAPVFRGYGYDQAITNGANFTTVVGVNKTIVGQKHLETQYEAIRLANQGLNNTAKITEQDLKKNVTAQYITAYGDLQQLRFNREI